MRLPAQSAKVNWLRSGGPGTAPERRRRASRIWNQFGHGIDSSLAMNGVRSVLSAIMAIWALCSCPYQEGTLCLPYDAVTSDMMEQFVLDEAHLLDCEECGQLLQELNTQYASLSTELETIHAKLKGDTSGRKEKSHLESVLEEVNKYVFEAGHCVSVQRPINDISRELVQAMAEAYETPVYLGTYESDQLTPYTGQQICNFQYNFCVPVDSKELKCRLRFGIHSAMEFEGFYQLLISLGGHILFWR